MARLNQIEEEDNARKFRILQERYGGKSMSHGSDIARSTV